MASANSAGASSSTDPRPRDGQGQFASGAEVSPRDMNRAYGIRRAVALMGGRKKSKAGAMPPPSLVPLSATRRAIVQLQKFDLGEKNEFPAGCCAPSAPKKWYPSLYVSGDAQLAIPRSGKAVIEYRLRSREVREDEEGKTRHSANVEVHSIEPVMAKDEKPKGKTVGGFAVNELSAPVRRVVELAFGDRFFAGAAGFINPGAAAAKVWLRTRQANAIKAGRMIGRDRYPKATQRAVNAVARQHGTNPFHILSPVATPSIAQEDRIAAALRRNSRGIPSLYRQAAGFESETLRRLVGLEAATRTSFVEKGGYYVITRPDGSRTRVPKRGLGNRLQRNAGTIAAVTAGAVGGGYLTRRLIAGRG